MNDGEDGARHESRISKNEARIDNIVDDIRSIIDTQKAHDARLTAQERFKSQLMILWAVLIALGSFFAESLKKVFGWS